MGENLSDFLRGPLTDLTLATIARDVIRGRPAELPKVSLVVGGLAFPNLACPYSLSIYLVEDPIGPERESPDTRNWPDRLPGKEGVRDEGVVLQIWEKILETDRKDARQAQELCLGVIDETNGVVPKRARAKTSLAVLPWSTENQLFSSPKSSGG